VSNPWHARRIRAALSVPSHLLCRRSYRLKAASRNRHHTQGHARRIRAALSGPSHLLCRRSYRLKAASRNHYHTQGHAPLQHGHPRCPGIFFERGCQIFRPYPSSFTSAPPTRRYPLASSTPCEAVFPSSGCTRIRFAPWARTLSVSRRIIWVPWP